MMVIYSGLGWRRAGRYFLMLVEICYVIKNIDKCV